MVQHIPLCHGSLVYLVSRCRVIAESLQGAVEDADALARPRIPGLDLSIDCSGHEELVLRVERANVEAGGRVRLQRVEKAALLEVEAVNVCAVADEVDVAVGRVVDKVSTEFRNPKSVVATKLSVDLK